MVPSATLGTLVLLLLAGPISAQVRTWTDSTGTRQVQAQLFTSQPNTAWLRRADGEVFGVPLSELSKADQAYVAEFARRRHEEAEADRRSQGHQLRYRPGRLLGHLANRAIEESSGLVASRRHPGLFWTHNDSDDEPRIYLLDAKGRDLGSCLLEGIRAYDWEDIAAFRADGKDYLLLADTGNNALAAAVHMLYVIEEPPLDAAGNVAVKSVPVLQTIHLSYEDDFRNCEAVAVDPKDRTILLVSKERTVECNVYGLPWPQANPQKAYVARVIARLKIPLVTAMDVSPDGRRAVVLSYGNAYEYTRAHGESWATAFSRQPREIDMPERVQGESICYGLDGKTLYLTSEKLPTPLWEVPPEE